MRRSDLAPIPLARSSSAPWRAALLLLLAATTGAARAHTDEYFDSRPSAHGGQTRMAGPMHVEFVRQGDDAVLYVTDHADRPLATTGGTAVLRVAGADLRITLAPVGDNRFVGHWPPDVPPDAVIVAFVKLPEFDAQTVRFGGGKPAATSGGAHDDADMAHHHSGDHDHAGEHGHDSMHHQSAPH